MGTKDHAERCDSAVGEPAGSRWLRAPLSATTWTCPAVAVGERSAIARAVVVVSLLATVAAYAGGLGNPFIYDDVPLIVVNALLRTPHGLGTFFRHAVMTSSPVWPGHYRPVLMLTFWLDYQLGGVAPIGYRVTNLGIHLVNGWLVWCLLRRVLARWQPAARVDPASAFGASLFLLHPIQSITIDLVLKRNSSLCALFMLAAVLLFARAHDDDVPTQRRRTRFAAALACGVLAMLTKEDAVILPALVALFAVATRTARARAALPFAIAPIAFVVGIAPHETIAHAEANAVGHLLAQPIALGRYARMLVDPDAIAIAYDLRPIVHPFPWLRLVALVGLAVVVVAIGLGRRRWPLVAFATAWAAIVLAPTSSVFPIWLTMDEVRCYAALVFFYGLGGVGLARVHELVLERGRALATAPFLAVAPWLVVCVLALAADWRIVRTSGDALSAYAHAVARYPTSQLGNRGLCEQLFGLPPSDGAIAQCRRAVELWPDEPRSRYFLTGALAKAGRFDEALVVADAAVRRFPESDVT